MITQKDLLKNINLLKEKLEKNTVEYIPEQEVVMNSPVFWVDKEKEIFAYMKDSRLIFQNKT